MPQAFDLKPIQIKSFEEEEKANIKYIDGLDENYDVYFYLYGFIDKKPVSINSDFFQKNGIINSHKYPILKSLDQSVGEYYIYNLESKKQILSEINTLLSFEKNMPDFAKNWLAKLQILVEKSILIEDSTLIVRFEV